MFQSVKDIVGVGSLVADGELLGDVTGQDEPAGGQEAEDPRERTGVRGGEGICHRQGDGHIRVAVQDRVKPRPASGNTHASNNPPVTSAAAARSPGQRPETEIALHSGAVYKGHSLVPYESLEVWRGLELRYDSERADPRPIIHTGFSDVASGLPETNLISKLAVKRGNFTHEVAGYPGDATGRLTGGEHFFDVPDGATTLDVSLQADLRALPSGLYTFESTNRFAIAASQAGARPRRP